MGPLHEIFVSSERSDRLPWREKTMMFLSFVAADLKSQQKTENMTSINIHAYVCMMFQNVLFRIHVY